MNTGITKKIKDLNILSFDSERISRRFIEPATEYLEFGTEEVNQSIVHRFESQVEKYPAKTAVKTARRMFTYRELNEAANRIAHVICRYYGAVNKGVALLFEHDSQMVAAIMGILKSGNFYIPLDPTYPPKRLIYILNDSNAKILLTDNNSNELAKHLLQQANHPVEPINVDMIDIKFSRENPGIKIVPRDLAYILYTSGSTGLPKGVVQNHRNVLHFIRVYTDNLHINAQDKLTLFSSYSFDAAIMDIYGALLNGAALYPYNIKEAGSMGRMAAWLKEEKITIYHSIPTVYRFFTDTLSDDDRFPGIRLIVLGGEEVYKNDVEKYKRFFPADCLFINGLGPTESTVTLQYFINKETGITKEIVPVGFPVDKTKVVLVDDDNKEANIFGSGEILYQSNHLALGYLNKLEKSAEVFVTDPLNGRGRVYRSGDFGRRLPDGNIEFVGRRDFQVKIRGYRVELGEIESTLDKIPGIKKSVVVCCKKDKNENFLVGYYVKEKEIEENDFIKTLKKSLPEYMVPAVFINLEEFPLTPSGKINRNALPKSDISRLITKTRCIAPGNEIQEKLLEIWKKVLKLETISIDSDFFELGGHSLNIMQVISHIHREFSLIVPLMEVVRSPTIEELAEVIKRIKDTTAGIPRKEPALSLYPPDKLECVEKLNNGRCEKNMFIIHPRHGMVNQYKELAVLLEKDYNIYGIQARGLNPGEKMSETPEEIVNDYVEQILKIQEGGPYIIGGYCAGVFIAYELVRILESLNYTVERFVMFNARAFLSESYIKLLKTLEYLPGFLKKFVHLINKKRFKKAKLKKQSYEPGQNENEMCGMIDEIDLQKKKVGDNIEILIHHILPLGIVKTPLLIIKAQKTNYTRDMEVYFNKITKGKITIIEIPGDHNSIFEEPNVRYLAGIIKGI